VARHKQRKNLDNFEFSKSAMQKLKKCMAAAWQKRPAPSAPDKLATTQDVIPSGARQRLLQNPPRTGAG
jgi:hypothetical protein